MKMGFSGLRKCFIDKNKPHRFQFIVDVDFKTDAFREYIEMTEVLVEKQVRQELKEMDKLFSEGLGDLVEMGPYSIKEHIYSIYYSSILISIYSFLEQVMYELCLIAEVNQLEIDPTSIQLQELSGKGVFQFKRYMQKVLKIDFTDVNDQWNEITKFNKLRNVFVHQPDHSVRSDDSRINSIKEIKNISFKSSDDRVVFRIDNKLVLYELLRAVHGFLKGICVVQYKH